MLAVFILGSLMIARGRGFSVGRIALGFVGVLVVGALCAVPGAVCWLLNITGSASGTSPMPAWPTIVFLVGSAAGALAGLLAIEGLIYRTRFRALAWFTALAGFGTGAAMSFLALSLTQNSTWGEPAWLILSPLAVAAATVAGYSLMAAKSSSAQERFTRGAE